MSITKQDIYIRNWLCEQTGTDPESMIAVNNLWMNYLGGLGCRGSLNDRKYEWLRGLGYSDTLDNMLDRWYENERHGSLPEKLK